VLTGEHGIGCGKRKYMPLMFGPAELRLMWQVKEAFDPDLLCNPDKVLPDRDEIAEFEPLLLPEGSFSRVAPEAAAHNEQGWFEPADEEALQKIFGLAQRERQPVVVRGAGTKLGPSGDDVAVISTKCLNHILAYDYENLTITVQGGVTLPQIEEVVADHGQMLALRPRFAQRATVGGILAANESGPHRLLYGGPRDLVTRIKAVLPSGEVVSFGSSCVKNVAGYAVEKLFIGSCGSLGAILEVTLRTLPRPEALGTVALSVDDPSAAAPLLAELVETAGEPNRHWTLLVGLEGFTEDVEEMAGRLGAMAAEHGLGDWHEIAGDYLALWSDVTNLAAQPAGTAILKASCQLSATTTLTAELNALDSAGPLRAAPGLGLVHCAVSSNQELHDYQSQAQALAEKYGGTTGWLAPTPRGLATLPQGTSREICRRLKSALDPHNILPNVLGLEDSNILHD